MITLKLSNTAVFGKHLMKSNVEIWENLHNSNNYNDEF